MQTKQGDMEELIGERIENKEYVNVKMFGETVVAKLIMFATIKDQKSLSMTWPHMPDKRGKW